jgi:NAD(P)H dehydrogenase (quinone)
VNIGIIVHSDTGNTYSVAQRILEELLREGHSVSLKKVIAIDDKQKDIRKIQLKTIPDVGAYDALIFGAPVRGFSLSPVLSAYLSQIPSLQRKKIECFVTQFFPYPWMGGNRAIKQMKDICQLKNGKVIETGIVNWSSKHRNEKIDFLVEEQIGLF